MSRTFKMIGLVLVGWFAALNVQAKDLNVDNPDALQKTRSLGRVIAETRNKPVHVLFVHGIAAEGAGSASNFMQGLCKYGPVKCPPGKLQPTRKFIDLGQMPQAQFLEKAIWRDDNDWKAAQPFIDRYVFNREGAPPVVVDEVNWWPLVLGPKCRFLVGPEAALSGIDKRHVKLCHTENSAQHLHNWYSDSEYAEVMKGPKISGGGAWLNRSLKQQMMNWGLTDAVLALGPLRTYFRQTIDRAFLDASQFDEKGVGGQEFVVVSESLGSFVVMDAAANEANATPTAQEVVGATSNLYFFANQFALLELGRIKGLSASFGAAASGASASAAKPEVSPLDVLGKWSSGQMVAKFLASPHPKQIIAFSDPSDILTYDVPSLPSAAGKTPALVVNIYDRNTFTWFGLAANPLKAHTGHSGNDAVLRQIFTVPQ